MRTKIITEILKYWDLRILPNLSLTDKMRVRLAIDLALASLGLSTIVTFIAIYNLNFSVFVPVLASFVMSFLTLYYVYHQKLTILYYHCVVGFSVFFSIANVFIHDDFGIQFVYLLCIYLAYVFFDSTRTKFIIVISIVLMYLSSRYFSSLMPSEYIIRIYNAYYIKSILFFFYLAWIGTLINHYKKEVIEAEEKAKELIGTLQTKNEDLKAVSNEMERFNYIASHDLKTPLRSVIGFLDLIKIRLRQNRYEEIDEFMLFVKESSEQMNLLTDDILAFSRINQEIVQIETVELQEVLSMVLADLETELQAKNVLLELHGMLPTIQTDKNLITTIFYNLIKNGFTYNTAVQPKIKIYSTINEDKVTVYFEDNGIGIHQKYHEKVFQHFKRLHTFKEYQGSGLGLGICKKIIQSMNGDIILESEAGKGSKFRLVLPKNISMV